MVYGPRIVMDGRSMELREGEAHIIWRPDEAG
jgi:hypothetical protein